MVTQSSIVIVGNGMVSVRLVERLRGPNAGRAAGRPIVVIGEEPRPAYDRVRLTHWFDDRDAEALSLGDAAWYRERQVELRLGERVVAVDRAARVVRTDRGAELAYGDLVLATGSAPWVPPLPGIERPGVFVYRTIEDLEGIADWAATRARRCVVVGGGLLGLEAARAAVELGLETHVVELAPRLMPRQLDEAASAILVGAVRALGVEVHLGCATRAVVGDEGDGAVGGLELADGSVLQADLVIVSAGIKPRDELARAAGLAVGPRGGIVVDDGLATSDAHVFAAGECALHRGQIYGLVAPGYAMADVLARRLGGDASATFAGADLSAKLKLMGVDVASFGDPFAEGDGVRAVVVHDLERGVYQKLLVAGGGAEGAPRLVGGMLVGDATAWPRLTAMARAGEALSVPALSLVAGTGPGNEGAHGKGIPDAAGVCTCHDVSAGAIRAALGEGAPCSVDAVKKCTRAGTGCGGCLPVLVELVAAEQVARGAQERPRLCEHFAKTRQELFEIVAVTGIADFAELLAAHGEGGAGCEICKPTAASIFASLGKSEMILDKHAALQDTNDRFLANLQRRGLYSVVPRIPGGEITPEKLIVLGQVAARHKLYVKITGGQRIDLFGARVEQLPEIWEELVAAGFESGHAYGKAMRTVKSCVGSTWCRYGVQDSVGVAIRLENRYKGVRAPHKLKAAVSGCVRECAEAQSKDFGVIATERGYNLYVGGNGGAKPRHADLLAADLDEATLVRLIDRFVMFYIRTADRLTRTSVWLEKLEGGLAHLRDVVVHDSLGIAAELERQMQVLVDGYACEWAAVVNDPAQRARFRAAAGLPTTAEGSDPGVPAEDTITWVEERGQRRPADWPKRLPVLPPAPATATPRWTRVARAADLPADGGITVHHGRVRLALFRFGATGKLYATQDMCPHKQDLVLSRGLLGDQAGEPKVACPQHKKTFSLETGACLSGDVPAIATFAVREIDGDVWALLPEADALEPALCPGHAACAHGHADHDAQAVSP